MEESMWGKYSNNGGRGGGRKETKQSKASGNQSKKHHLRQPEARIMTKDLTRIRKVMTMMTMNTVGQRNT